MTEYRYKIYALLERIKELCATVRHPTKEQAEHYLNTVTTLVGDMTTGFQGDSEHNFLLPRFRACVDREEERLRKGLETVKYDIDALDTLALINGRRGIERVSK